MFSFGTMFRQNETKDSHSTWKPQVGFYVKELGQSRIVRGNLRVEVDFAIQTSYGSIEYYCGARVNEKDVHRDNQNCTKNTLQRLSETSPLQI